MCQQRTPLLHWTDGHAPPARHATAGTATMGYAAPEDSAATTTTAQDTATRRVRRE